MSDTELALLIDRFMRRIHGALQTKSSGFDRNNIGPGGGIILLTLSDMGCTGLSELTSRVARDKSQMTRSIRSLEAKGLIERKPSTCDARVSLVALTTRGEETVETIKDVLTETIDDLLEPVGQADKAKLKDILKLIVP